MTTTTNSVLSSLADLVGDELKSVSYKWLAREFNIPYDTSKRVLFEFLAKKNQKVEATFFISGWTKDDPARHVVRIVEGSALEDAKSQLSVITAIHVYSVQPSSVSKGFDSIYNQDHDQSEKLFRKLISGGHPSSVPDTLSSVQSSGIERNATKFIGNQSTKHATVSKSGDGVATTTAPKKEEEEKPKPKTKTPPPPPAKAKPVKRAAALKKTAQQPVEKKQKKEEEVKKPASHDDTNDTTNNKGEEDEGVILGKPSVTHNKNKIKRTIVDSDSDDDNDDFVEEKRDEKFNAKTKEEKEKVVVPVKQSKAKASPQSKKKVKTEAAAKTKKTPTKKASQKSVADVADANTQSGAKKYKRIMKTYFNDSGEEVTEMVDVTDDENDAEPIAGGGGAKEKGEVKKQESSPAKKPSAAADKKSGNAAAPQRSIASFFSKK